ncbi:AcvB/VirJ family lysyl-phosphatidylglycerol hydrolase [Agriterribacter sp.]|uniref:AcvB/VirJ family lysyl-phosphatidylglycerol hydrolase n=1 Tax=Agriterribacter sp. TaxID=2821509 RepID=UPI002B7773C4|nr:AcvB/VirJ family lysyl-phosphatidylglycerol hydrolase [Agriterribacter sp.]HTN07364.1 AcvB/VirJ family lysyl-phosphatidylglycerol hydrolase [Agriterribacter sp.]
MKHKTLLLLVFLWTFLLPPTLFAQNLPVQEWAAASRDKPFIFYISGDGGLNTYSTDLCAALNKEGYEIAALNARTYFWDKKTPGKTAMDVNNYLSKKTAGRKNKQVVFIGYSFGADVLPFIISRLSKSIHDNLRVSFMMASSGSTDFEIHWSDILGENKRRSMDVVSEINKLVEDNLVIVTASDEHTPDLKEISLKKYTHEILPGGHHFDGDTEEVARVLLKHINWE